MWTNSYVRRLLALTLILATFLLAGCTQSGQSPTEKSGKVKLFYGSPGNEALAFEMRSITFSTDMEKYENTVRALIKGPKDQSLVANIPKNTLLYGIIRQNSSLIVDLSSGFGNFPGSVAEIVAVGSLVNTLTQFPEIDSVKLLIEGEEYIGPSGEPRGFMKTFEDNAAPRTVTQEITLYFADKDAMYLHPEKRAVRVPEGSSQEDLLEIILTELISGPHSGTLSRTIPREVNVNSVEISGDLVHVDFSEEMHTKHWGGAAGEAMTINSIVDTLTELPGIKRVRMTVMGKPMAIEHAVLTDPVKRNPDIIRP